MGRTINAERKETVLRTIDEHDGQLPAAGVARLLGLHPEEVNRVLTAQSNLKIFPKSIVECTVAALNYAKIALR